MNSARRFSSSMLPHAAPACRTSPNASILRYKGADGRLRVSARHLDETLTTENIPVHSFDRIEKLQPGEVVDIDIDILPIGLLFYPGEQLRLMISAQPMLGPMMPMVEAYVAPFGGEHVIHTGGDRASYLQLPVQSPARSQTD